MSAFEAQSHEYTPLGKKIAHIILQTFSRGLRTPYPTLPRCSIFYKSLSHTFYFWPSHMTLQGWYSEFPFQTELGLQAAACLISLSECIREASQLLSSYSFHLSYWPVLSAVAISIIHLLIRKTKQAQALFLCSEFLRHNVKCNSKFRWSWTELDGDIPRSKGRAPYPRWMVRMCFWIPTAVLRTFPQFFQRHLNITFMEF